MPKSAQQRALANYRDRLAKSGLVRFEVTGRNTDRALVRSIAQRLAKNGPDAERLRAIVTGGGGTPPKKGGILKALLASPLAGADLDLTRPREKARKVDI